MNITATANASTVQAARNAYAHQPIRADSPERTQRPLDTQRAGMKYLAEHPDKTEDGVLMVISREGQQMSERSAQRTQTDNEDGRVTPVQPERTAPADRSLSGVEATAPAREEAAPAAAQEATPVREEAAPVREEAAPAREEAAPVREEAAPVREEAEPVREDAAPAAAKEPARPKEEEEEPAVRETPMTPVEQAQDPAKAIKEEQGPPDIAEHREEVTREAQEVPDTGNLAQYNKKDLMDLFLGGNITLKEYQNEVDSRTVAAREQAMAQFQAVPI